MHFHNVLLENSWPEDISTVAKLEMAKNVHLPMLRDRHCRSVPNRHNNFHMKWQKKITFANGYFLPAQVLL